MSSLDSSVVFWRRVVRRRVVVCVVAGLSAVCLAGCSRRIPSTSGDPALRLGSMPSAGSSQVLSELLFAEPLMVLDWNGRPQERLATHWDWQDDLRTLSIQLRPGVKFHDGRALTAPAVADILRQKIAKQRKDNTLEIGFEHVTHIEPRDQGTLLIRLNQPDTFLIFAIAGTLIVDDEHAPDVGTGPFRILARQPNVEAEKNPYYYRGAPGIDRVRISGYESPRGAWAALMRSEVDMVPEVNTESVGFLEGASVIHTYASIRPFYIPLGFNLRHPILQRVEVRRALAQAIDREKIVQVAMGGHGKVADDPIWPSHWAYSTVGGHRSYDPAAAARQLDAAGLRVRPITPGAMASRFTLTCLFWSDNLFERIALVVQRQLAEVGVDLRLEPVGGVDLRNRLSTGRYDTYLFRLTSGRSLDWTYRFWHSATGGAAVFQESGYRGVDGILDKLRVTPQDEDVRVAVADLRARFNEDVPAAFLAWIQTTRAVDTRFDVGDPNDPDMLANLWRWHLRSNEVAAR